MLVAVYFKFYKTFHLYRINDHEVDLTTPLSDPSIFIHRFCDKLNFGEKRPAVQQTAIKLVQSMKRDWIHTGRRPSGLCGAAILMASKYHGVERDLSEIVGTVNACDETVRKRVKEFKATTAASLTRGEFEALDIKTDEKDRIQSGADDGMDPPSFIKHINKNKWK